MTSERPAAVVQRVDVSAPTTEPAARATSEDALFLGYNTKALETRPCACGGDVTADPLAPARGVAAHQFTGRHRAWRENQEP